MGPRSISAGEPDPALLQSAIWGWWDAGRRALPWRGLRDPWAIWVSEIMLQQTRAEVVAERFAPFLARYPSVESLAAAPLDDVLAAWSGLGYYRRARSLHAAAVRVVADYDGRVPDQPALLRELPGVGDYTAASLSSIAYGQPRAAVDGNVERIAVRMLGETAMVPSAAVRKRVQKFADANLDRDRPGDWNQALMDLGAEVCRPRNPICGECPWSKFCVAAAGGLAEELPHRKSKAPARVLRLDCVVVRGSAGVLLTRRAADEGWMPGLWELPTIEHDPRGSLEGVSGEDSRAVALAKAVRAATGIAVKPQLSGSRVLHSIVDRRLEIDVWTARTTARGTARAMPRAMAKTTGWMFADLDLDLNAPGTPALVGVVRKILAALADA
jgi:A/G-specific adenine glycosylase